MDSIKDFSANKIEDLQELYDKCAISIFKLQPLLHNLGKYEQTHNTNNDYYIEYIRRLAVSLRELKLIHKAIYSKTMFDTGFNPQTQILEGTEIEPVFMDGMLILNGRVPVADGYTEYSLWHFSNYANENMDKFDPLLDVLRRNNQAFSDFFDMLDPFEDSEEINPENPFARLGYLCYGCDLIDKTMPDIKEMYEDPKNTKITDFFDIDDLDEDDELEYKQPITSEEIETFKTDIAELKQHSQEFGRVLRQLRVSLQQDVDNQMRYLIHKYTSSHKQ